MKNGSRGPRPGTLRLVVLAGWVLFAGAIFPQGSLTPLGAPAPTFKTLQQIEPRTPISSLPFTISAPGSYYLTSNLTPIIANQPCIRISSDDVTLDLGGFELSTAASSPQAILIEGTHNHVTIRNGTIRGPFSGGVGLTATCFGLRVEGVHVSGCNGSGIVLGAEGTAEGCNVANGSGSMAGILGFDRCRVSHCTVSYQNDNTFAPAGISVGSDSVIADCVARGNASDGINGMNHCVVTNCSSSFNGIRGFSFGEGTVLSNCAAANNTQGFVVQNNATMHNCLAQDNNGYGIAVHDSSTLTNCSAVGNAGVGGISTGAGCTIIGCSARNNTNNAAISAGIMAGAGCVISHCTAIGNTSSASFSATTGMGIYTDKSLIVDCTTNGNRGDGIRVEAQSTVRGCNSTQNGVSGQDGAGIHAQGSSNRIESNNVTANDRGIDVIGSDNLVIHNRSKAIPRTTR